MTVGLQTNNKSIN